MKRTDAELRQAVVSELQWDTRIDEADIGVAVDAGVVALTGTVRTWAERNAAVASTHRVHGVLDVANEIRVRSPAVPERSDTQIAHAVRHALEWDVFVPETRVRSTVTQGCVTLEGEVDYINQRDDAERAVRNLAGVLGVTNKLEVKPLALGVDIERSIESALERHARREAAHVRVEVHDGRVTLSGIVGSYAEKAAVLGAARGTVGVRSVQDRLRIDIPAG
jgi:osmotically-inducible protein OsmY